MDGTDPTLRVTVRLDPELHELLLAELVDFDFDAFRSEGDRLRAYGPGEDWEPDARRQVVSFLRRHDRPEEIDASWITPENWNARWESRVEPVAAGPFWITPSWRRREVDERGEPSGIEAFGRVPNAADRVIEVDPKMSFGTGHHPSTRLALRLAARCVKEGDRILDAGAGTGVLSVAAVRLGAARVVAFDNSPPARANGRETLARNGVADRVDYRLGELEVVGAEERFDGILANIDRRVLLEMLPGLLARVAPGGFVVLSGLLADARARMGEAIEEVGLRRVAELVEGDWFAWAVEVVESGTGSEAERISEVGPGSERDPGPEGDPGTEGRSRRVAAIDVGTNTVLLLVAEVGADGSLRVLEHRERFARLGEGLDASGRLKDAAVERVIDVLEEYREVADRHGVDAPVAGGTSAVRDAADAEGLVRRAERETGIRIRTLSGEEEARVTFEGALSAFRDRPGSYAVIDVGGGSTELVTGRIRANEPSPIAEGRVSLDVGAVRLTERFLRARPPGPDARARTRDHVRSSLGGIEVPPEATLVGASGTTIALALLDRGVSRWEEVGEEPVVLGLEAVRARRRMLEHRTPEQILAVDPDVLAGREDVFTAGVLIVEVVMEETGCDRIEVGTRGIRHGLALRAATGAWDPR